MNEKKTIGLLEEIILLIVMNNDEINGAEVLRSYVEIMNRSISLPAIISVLKRLEKKDFLASRYGEPLPERGGKRKRLYKVTKSGFEVVSVIQKSRTLLWAGIAT